VLLALTLFWRRRSVEEAGGKRRAQPARRAAGRARGCRPILAAQAAPVPAPPPHRVRRRALQGAAALALSGVLVVPWFIPGVAQSFLDWVNGPQAVATAPDHDPSVLPEPAPVLSGTLLSGPTARQLRAWRAAAGRPDRVVVPRLQVASTVLPISGDSGVLLPPSDPQEIGWWQEGPRAGSREGTTILTGHTVHTGGGAFDHLDDLEPGDVVRVHTASGSLRYRVTRVRDYRTGALADHARQIFRLTGPGRLRLITCSDWNGTIYLSNTVVTAVPAPR